MEAMSDSQKTTRKTRREPSGGQLTRHRVRESIKQMILDGTNRPGTRLVQEQLAKQLNVSRGVVREALMELQASGLVQTNDNCGARVMPLDPDRLIEAFELREVMEGLAVRRCCERITVAQLRELHELVNAIDCHFHAREWRAGGLLDRQLRLRLIEIADSQMLSQLASTCMVITKFVTVEIADVAQPARAYHELLDIIASGDAEGAEQLARLRVRSNRTHVEQAMAAGTPMHWLVGGPDIPTESKSTE